MNTNTYIWNLGRWDRRSYVQGSKGDTDVRNRLLDLVGEGEGGMIWEKSIETYTLRATGTLMNDAGQPKPVLWDNPEWWGGEGGGGGSGCGGHMYIYGWFIPMYGKIHHNIVK